MDFASITGLILGVVILLVALFSGGIPIQNILQPEALLIVFGGTFTSLMIHFSFEEIHEALGALRRVFQLDYLSPEDVRDYIIDASMYIRSKGILAIQPLLAHVEIPFLQRGLQMIVDNIPGKDIELQMATEMEVLYQKDSQLAKVFETAGGVAPTMGIIGAVVGLIKVANLFHSPDQLGPAIGSAFTATLYGVSIANMVLLPIAGKIKQRARNEFQLKTLILQGVLAIRDGENPSVIKDRLGAYIYSNALPGLTQQQYGPQQTYDDHYADEAYEPSLGMG